MNKDEKFYDLEESTSNACLNVGIAIIVFVALVVAQMACNWLNNF